MTAVDIAQQYFDGWNRRDPGAVLATIAERGTYSDPGTGGLITGQAFAGWLHAGLLRCVSGHLVLDRQRRAGSAGLVAAADHAWHQSGIDDGVAAHRQGRGAAQRRLHPRGRWPHPQRRGLLRFARRPRTARAAGDRAAEGDRSLHLRHLGAHVLGGATGKPGAFSITALHSRGADDTQAVTELGEQYVIRQATVPILLEARSRLARGLRTQPCRS